MKKCIFILAAIGMGWAAQAQPAPLFFKHLSPKQQNHRRMVTRLLAQQNLRLSLEKPTTTRQRVIAQTYSEEGSTDSTTFRYSGNRGSNFNYNSPDLMYTEDYYGYYTPGDGIVTNLSDMQADSISYYSDGEWYRMYAAHFRADNQMDTMISAYSSSPGSVVLDKYIRVFNSQGYLAMVYYTSFDQALNTYDTVARQGIYYDNNFSRVLSDTTWEHTGAAYDYDMATNYVYDHNGLLTEVSYYSAFSPVWDLEEKITLTYTTNGKLETIKDFESDGQNLTLSGLDSFAYTPGIGYFTTWIENYWDNGLFENGAKAIQYPGANGLPDSVLTYEKDDDLMPYYFVGKWMYNYNSYNNPVLMTAYGGDSTDITTQRFYYEEYDDGLGIDPVDDGNSTQLSVYPNPFASTLNIRWTGNPSDNADMSVYNTLGQQVLKRKLKLQPGRNTIDLSALPAGAYILQLNNERGRLGTAKILKH